MKMRHHQLKQTNYSEWETLNLTNLWEWWDAEGLHVSAGQLCAVGVWRRRGGVWRWGVSRWRHRRLGHICPTVPLLRRLVCLPQLPDAGVLGRLLRVRRSHDLGLGFRQPSFHVAVRVWRRGGVGGNGRRGRSVRLSGPAYHGVEGIVSTCGGRATAHLRVSVLSVFASPRRDLGKLPALRTKVRVRPAAGQQQQEVHAGWAALFSRLCKPQTGCR